MGNDDVLRRRFAPDRIGAAGRRSETRTARRLKAKPIPSSGSASLKGDMEAGEFLVEAKSTVRGSLRLDLDYLLKIATEAQLRARTPALTVTFTLPNGKPRPGGKWVMVPEWWFREHV